MNDLKTCHCRACNASSNPFERRMVLCAICGNKRCPHAADHNYACTNSNEPNQKGSVYCSPELSVAVEKFHECLPRSAGHYWWRETSACEWRMVEITPSSDGTYKPIEMNAYDREKSEWGGRNLGLWQEQGKIGEWVAITKPVSSDLLQSEPLRAAYSREELAKKMDEWMVEFFDHPLNEIKDSINSSALTFHLQIPHLHRHDQTTTRHQVQRKSLGGNQGPHHA
jgi:hypothetical protein